MKSFLSSSAFCLPFLLNILFINIAFAQQNDIIIMRSNDAIQAKVEEVGVNAIRYHRADNMGGPIYEVPKSDVNMIVYANGTRDVMNPGQGDNYTPQPAAVNDQQVTTPPPPMPTYDQPYCPGPGYIWTPGYWAWAPAGYYWVPGVWVFAPHPGYLWTPGYWGFGGGYYGWHAGYWGEHIGYYGGVYYGYGYGGSGYYGGRWDGGVFRYNTAVSRVDVTVVHTTYVDNTVVREAPANRASFNGEGGVRAQPTAAEQVAMKEPHIQPTAEQQSHVQAAMSDKTQYAANNGGKPTVTAMNKPGGQAFSSQGKTAALHPGTQPVAKPGPTAVTKEPVKSGTETGTPPAGKPGATETHAPAAGTTESHVPAAGTTAPGKPQPGKGAPINKNTKNMKAQPKKPAPKVVSKPEPEKR